MEIQNNVSFGTKFRTVNILETTTLRCIESASVADLKPEMVTFGLKKLKAQVGEVTDIFCQKLENK